MTKKQPTSHTRLGAKERRERRVRAKARIRLQLCRDAVRIASHRGGDVCWRAHTDASTHTALTILGLPRLRRYATCAATAASPVMEYVTPATAVSYFVAVPVIGYVSLAPVILSTLHQPWVHFLPVKSFARPCTTGADCRRLKRLRTLRGNPCCARTGDRSGNS